MIVAYDKLLEAGVRKRLIHKVAIKACVKYHVAWRTITNRGVYEDALGWLGKSIEQRTKRAKGGRKKKRAGRGVKFFQSSLSKAKTPLNLQRRPGSTSVCF